eukprot:6219935-Alexandrium_andersonii.AAC.1
MSAPTSTLTGAPTAASCARARCFSSPSRRLTNCKRSEKVWSSSLSPRARRKSSGSKRSRAQIRAPSSRD